GSSHLKMAYEEVLFPKGIDTVKQGNSELFRFIGDKIMWEAMDINNTCSIHQIVEDTLSEAKHKQWDFNDFIAMSKWKAKGGLAYNKIFMERMRKKIESGEKNSQK
ncbi:13009_t:CDS:2, partial [Funneliformis caledonium]